MGKVKEINITELAVQAHENAVQHVQLKMQYNTNRSYKHGKQY